MQAASIRGAELGWDSSPSLRIQPDPVPAYHPEKSGRCSGVGTEIARDQPDSQNMHGLDEEIAGTAK